MTRCCIVGMAAAAMAMSVSAAPDLLVADFEGGNYGAWTVEGTAFGSGPAKGTLGRQRPVSGFTGNGLVNTFIADRLADLARVHNRIRLSKD